MYRVQVNPTAFADGCDEIVGSIEEAAFLARCVGVKSIFRFYDGLWFLYASEEDMIEDQGCERMEIGSIREVAE